MKARALEARPGPRPHNGASRTCLERFEVGHGAEFRGRPCDLLEHSLGRSQRSQDGRDLGPRVAAHGLLADVSRERLIAGLRYPGFEQGRRLREGDPVVRVFEIGEIAVSTRAPEHGRNSPIAAVLARHAQQGARHRAADLAVAVRH